MSASSEPTTPAAHKYTLTTGNGVEVEIPEDLLMTRLGATEPPPWLSDALKMVTLGQSTLGMRQKIRTGSDGHAVIAILRRPEGNFYLKDAGLGMAF